jgi:HEPN domain-containing protein
MGEPPRPHRTHEERPHDHPPKREREPEDMPPPAPTKDPETLRKEDELRHELTQVKDKLDKTKSLGVDTTNIDQLLRTAKRNLSEGNHHKAKQYLGYASERIDNLMAKRDEAQRKIKDAKEVLSSMRGTADLTIVENFLVKADSLFEEGDYREAINYANKAKERAVRLQRREMRL